MHSLIITAHPSSKGFAHIIAKNYREVREQNGHTAEILDLYKTEFQEGFLTFEDTSDLKKPNEKRKALQEKIQLADELVFVFPTWWVNVPGILKNFFDTIFTGGFAYQYVSGKMFPKKLLTGKTARIFVTCDAIGWFYYLIGNPLKHILTLGTLGWCGVKTKSYTVFDRMRKRDEVARDKMIQKVRRIAVR